MRAWVAARRFLPRSLQLIDVKKAVSECFEFSVATIFGCNRGEAHWACHRGCLGYTTQGTGHKWESRMSPIEQISGPSPSSAAEGEALARLASPPSNGKRRVLWFPNRPDPYFVNMLDALNAQGRGAETELTTKAQRHEGVVDGRRETGGVEYFGIFLCPPPEESLLTKLPQPCAPATLNAGAWG